MAATVETRPALSTSTTGSRPSVFDKGSFPVKRIPVVSSPKPLYIVTPTTAGSYPVLLFLSGFCIPNSFYSKLLHHVSSHGYIVVAPQLYVFPWTSGPDELKSADAVAQWLLTGLQAVLPSETIQPNLKQLALVGHSRGAKTAFALALHRCQTHPPDVLGLIGIDPVDGNCVQTIPDIDICHQTQPKILTYVPDSMDLKIPVTVIGTCLGGEKKNIITPPCAPKKYNHEHFFSECKPTCYHFVAKEYGHMDMLDEGASALEDCMCASGKGSVSSMITCMGGIVVASLEAYLGGDYEDLEAIYHHPSIAPILLDPVDRKPKA